MLFLSALGPVAPTHDRYLARESLERAALALGGYRAEHGVYPESLDALVPGWLEAVPMDHFVDEPIRYRVDEEAVVIYSVGRNRTDDGGVDDVVEGDLVLRLAR